MPKTSVPFLALMPVLIALLSPASLAAPVVTLEQIRDYPYQASMTAAATGSRVAWMTNQRGRRNVWVAEGPDFSARQLTRYEQDDGQELTGLALTKNGDYVVYVRGGEHGSNFDTDVPVNIISMPLPGQVEVWSVPFVGGEPKVIGEGDGPKISPRGDQVAFLKGGEIWMAPVDGSAKAERIVKARGSISTLEWSPEGSRLAFVVERDGYSFVGVYSDAGTPLLWLAPSTAKDGSPTWSAAGTHIAFIRRAATGGVPQPVLTRVVQPWSLWIADTRTGEGRQRWQGPATLPGSDVKQLRWAAADRLVFNSYANGWQQLYSLRASSGEPDLLTPGSYMVEEFFMSSDRRNIVLTANTGPSAGDFERRHLLRLDVENGSAQQLTSGKGLEWFPVITGDGRNVLHLSATAQRPAVPAVVPLAGGASRLLAGSLLSDEYPAQQLVTPRSVSFVAADGVTVHGQVFEPRSKAGKRPAVVYIHGGPQRQMLLGWHYSDYYSNAYAVNQYLASRGFVVLAVNYRLGIGYGFDFHFPQEAGGGKGAAEYRDIVAAGKYLRSLPQVDGRRIGVYGGSYGGYLTAMALAHDSELFAAGVDIHGVHDWGAYSSAKASLNERFEQPPDADRILETYWRSSPVSAIATWRSPVLLIHGDDDRNVPFEQLLDLTRRLDQQGVAYEQLVIPDDTHHFMRYSNELRVNRATVDFLEKHLGRN